jgi:hypothetical protein
MIAAYVQHNVTYVAFQTITHRCGQILRSSAAQFSQPPPPYIFERNYVWPVGTDDGALPCRGSHATRDVDITAIAVHAIRRHQTGWNAIHCDITALDRNIWISDVRQFASAPCSKGLITSRCGYARDVNQYLIVNDISTHFTPKMLRGYCFSRYSPIQRVRPAQDDLVL